MLDVRNAPGHVPQASDTVDGVLVRPKPIGDNTDHRRTVADATLRFDSHHLLAHGSNLKLWNQNITCVDALTYADIMEYVMSCQVMSVSPGHAVNGYGR